MMNLNNMTSKQLKELGKQNGVKNWWNLSKAALIAALAVDSEEKTEPQPDTHQPEVIDDESKKIEALEPDELVTPEEEVNCEPDTHQGQLDEVEPKETAAPKIKKPNLKIHELTYDGRTQTIREWAAELEMPWPTLYDRVNRNGWTTEEALTTPLGGRRKAN